MEVHSHAKLVLVTIRIFLVFCFNIHLYLDTLYITHIFASSWLIPYLIRSYRNQTDETGIIYDIKRTQRSSYLSSKIQSVWDNELNNDENASLLKALFMVFKGQLYYYGVYFMIIEFIKIGQPLLIARLVLLFDHPETKLGKLETLVHAIIIVLSSLVQVLCNHNYQMGVMDLGMRIRTAACTLIYKKSLKLSKSALVETSVGQMVNLLSTDVGRLDYAIQNLHNIWMAPVETVIIMALLYGYVGWTGLVGVVVMLMVMPLQMCLAKWSSKYSQKTSTRSDERVRLMNEIISGMQVIKMYTWEKPFARIVERAREEEISKIRGGSIIKAILTAISMIMSRTAIFACILTYVVTGNTLTATYAYTITSFYQHLRITVTIFFPQAFLQLLDTRISMRRIRDFLLIEEVDTTDAVTTNGADNNKVTINVISMRDASFKWLKSSPSNTLDKINFEAASEQLVALVGRVGSGKTTLLHAILKEIKAITGVIEVKGTISYASQEPWLFCGSIRQNILFDQPYDEMKYNEVVRICCLEQDLNLFPNRDGSLVGEKGVSLSGGQRARINLARAVYKDADIYLLDDPLSAVDTHVGEKLFSECICGYLGTKCVVLVTHQLQYLRDSPFIYLLDNGRVRASGSYQEMTRSDSQFATLMEESKDQLERNAETNRLSVVEENMEMSQEYAAVETEREEMASGKVTWNVYKSYLKPGRTWFKAIVLLLGFMLNELFGSSADCMVTVWVNMKQEIHVTNTTSVGTLRGIQLIDEINLCIYSVLLVLFIIITFARTISFANYCVDASTRLHNSMFSRIVISPMKFFKANPSGRILNRFAKDINAVDDGVPATLQDTLTLGMSVLAISIIIGVMHPWLFIITSCILIGFYLMRLAFLSASRNIKRVEAVTRSPIYTHLSASLHGLSTIRAVGAQERLIKEFHDLQDEFSCANFMFITVNKGFAVWLDVACIVYILFVTLSMLFIERDTLGGSVGLSLTQAIALSGMFQWGIRQWAELENQMTSVERIREYADITAEMDENHRAPPRLWPEHGEVRFVDTSLRYAPSMPYVLKKLSFEIRPREKVGIVGRTGAGKSSLIQALFRLADIEGHIWIDGVDTKTVSLNVLRSKISIIPQEPVLFSGTMRRNLDPFEEYQDEVLWKALEEVELRNAVGELEAGLDSKMAEGGSNFSVGQRQLVCLARAIVRNNKILVLDEATANVDPHTDSLIQETIRRKFADCTVLTIAHRLNTIMDSDKVLVMDAGQAVEFDHPFSLLQNKQGVFYGLVRRTGSGMAESLYETAEQNFMAREQR